MAANSNNTNSYRLPVPLGYEDVFSHFYFARNPEDQPKSQSLLPSFQQIMVFILTGGVIIKDPFNEAVQLNHAVILGPVKKVLEYTLLPKTQMLVINFKPGSFYRFFGSIHDTHSTHLDPDTLTLENCFTDLLESLRRLLSPEEMIAEILKFSKPYLREKSDILKQFVKSSDSFISPIKNIAAAKEQTVRSIQRQHKKMLGYSAKELLRFERFIKAIQMLEAIAQKAVKEDWFQIIDSCGYYDQSQLIHDFKYFLALTPKEYLRVQRHICNPL